MKNFEFFKNKIKNFIDDSIDALHFLVTALFFAVSAVVAYFKIHSKDAIKCYVLSAHVKQYGKPSCAFNEMYWLTEGFSLKELSESYKQDHRLNFYEWTTTFLVIGCLLSISPKILWYWLQKDENVKFSYYCETTASISEETKDVKTQKVPDMVYDMSQKLHAAVKRQGNWMQSRPSLIFSMKLLNISLAIGLFCFIPLFIGQGMDLLWGVRLLTSSWMKTGLFPRVTHCDVLLSLGNKTENIHCHVPLNDFNETLFLFFYLWLLFVITVSSGALVIDIWAAVSHRHVDRLLDSALNLNYIMYQDEFDDFAGRYLGVEGRLIIKTVKRKSVMVAEELTLQMYRMYKLDHKMIPIIKYCTRNYSGEEIY